MNIVVLQDRLRSGGTERQSILLAEAFAMKGHETTLVSFRPGGALASTVAYAKHVSLQKRDWYADWFAPGLFRALRTLKPQVILCMGRMANCYAGSVQEALPDCVVIATMRTGKPLPWLFRRSLSRVKHVIANSQDARAALLQRYSVRGERVSVINNSLVFKASRSREELGDLRGKLGAGGRTLILLNVAMFRPEKNQKELIQIVEGFPPEFDCQLWLAGDGPCLTACENYVKENHLESRVRFLGWLADPTGLYAVADYAVHASWSESLSNFIIEAQAHGLPAVVYDAQGNRECMIPGKTGFVIPAGDRERFRNTLTQLAAESPENHARRSAEARAFARTSFDHSRQVNAYLNLFRVLGAKG